jgi:putative endonuclease
MVAAHIEYGRRGEERAAAWYAARGYEIVCRNWRCAVGEIDLIARRGRMLVICEVKARRSDAFGIPALAVGAAKQRRLRRLAAAWLAGYRSGRNVEVRFDVVAVTGDDVDVYESAF